MNYVCSTLLSGFLCPQPCGLWLSSQVVASFTNIKLNSVFRIANYPSSHVQFKFLCVFCPSAHASLCTHTRAVSRLAHVGHVCTVSQSMCARQLAKRRSQGRPPSDLTGSETLSSGRVWGWEAGPRLLYLANLSKDTGWTSHFALLPWP